MSRRQLGGGRILGSGRSLGPPAAKQPPPPPPSIQEPAQPPLPLPDHVLSPSTSSLSLPESGSGHSTPPSSFEPQDIASRISLDNGVLKPPSADRLACPICNEEMVTLLQLNRHLDDAHKEIVEEQQDEVKDWFQQQMEKAKKFQPLAVLNQKLKGLDVFESNNDPVRTSTPTPRHRSVDMTAGARSASPAPPPPPPKPVVDPDEVVSRTHWQKPSRNGLDTCSDMLCPRRLGTGPSVYTGINCRHCGKLFCEEHTMYQMKLSRAAKHEPHRGVWCRVCETCYKSRDGYNDKHGLERTRLDEFKTVREATVGKRGMESRRLEKRLTRLTSLLADPPPPEEIAAMAAGMNNEKKRWSLASWTQNDPKKTLEQSVVMWEKDEDILRCPYCQQDFSQYSFRRHHCRTCGKVVCGDLNTGCSTMLALNVATKKPPPNDTMALDVRLCKDCNRTLFSQSDFAASLTSPIIESMTKSYSNLLSFERGIRLMLPKFQKLLQALQDPDLPPSSQQLTDASRTRKRLMDAFAQYDTAARRIRDLPSTSPTQLKLQKAIHANASQFLHLHMLPLKALPKVLKHATPAANLEASLGTPNGKNALASIRYNHIRQGSSSNISISSIDSSRISELEAEEKSLRERLIVLEEQKFMVQEMVVDAQKRRKLDEVAALQGSLQDLVTEIDSLTKEVEGVRGEFEGMYTGAAPITGLGSGVNSPQRMDSGIGSRKKENG